MLDPLPSSTSASTPDVQGSTVVATYNGHAPFDLASFMHPSDVLGPFNGCIAPIPTHATTRYAFESRELAALLGAFESQWRPQLARLAAPSLSLSTPAAYESAVQCLAARPALPEGWVDFVCRVSRHRDITVRRVEDLKARWRSVPNELYLEVATARKLCNEVNKIISSWTLLSDAVAAWEEDHAESYLTKVWKWATGSTKAKAKPAPPAGRATVVQTPTDAVVVPAPASAAAALTAAAPEPSTSAPATPSRSHSHAASHSAPPSPASSTTSSRSSSSTGSSSLAAHHHPSLPFLAWTTATATPSLAQLSVINASPVPTKPSYVAPPKKAAPAQRTPWLRFAYEGTAFDVAQIEYSTMLTYTE
ncbi:hypothetical protein RQP46_002599 [Phenoliferia psychrophenolica]